MASMINIPSYFLRLLIIILISYSTLITCWKINLGADDVQSNSNQVRFWNFPNQNDHKYMEQIILNDIQSLKAAKLTRDFPLTVLIHGFNSNFTASKVSPQILKNAYLMSGFKNIIVVDWYTLAQQPNELQPVSYKFAVNNVPIVGKVVAEFLLFLLQNSRPVKNPDLIHLVGHSLGAHVSGIAGLWLKKLGKQSIGRITGLDPAFPEYFEKYGKTSRRLDKSDAKFVDILHTNIGLRGYPYPCGHVDFYANHGGPYQPFCLTPTLNDPDIVPEESVTGICSHRRAFYFYAQSISNKDKYYGCQCEQKPLNDTTTSENDAFNAFEYQCNKITTILKNCKNPTIFGQYVSSRAKGLYDMEIDLNNPSQFYE